MPKKKFTFRGYSIEELQKLPLDDFVKLLPARQRRSLTRGLTPREKKLIERIRRAREAGKTENPIRTHCREMVILPEMVDLKFAVHNGKEFIVVEMKPEMVGHCLMKRAGDLPEAVAQDRTLAKAETSRGPPRLEPPRMTLPVRGTH